MKLWYPGAVQLPGPFWKQGYNGVYVRQHKGCLYHSMEGLWQSAYARLMSTAKVSWTLSLTYDGIWLQHYPLNSVLWHGSCTFAGMKVAVEVEGRAGEPLTSIQVLRLAEFTAWIADEEQWEVIERRVTLWEHREMVEYGGDPTACPSGRIPWTEVIQLAMTIQELSETVGALLNGHAMQQAVLEQHVQDIGNLKTGMGWIAGGLALLKDECSSLASLCPGSESPPK